MSLYNSDAVRALMTMSASQVNQACRLNERMPVNAVEVQSAHFVGMDDQGNFHYDIVFKMADGGWEEDHVAIRYHRHERSTLTVPLAF